MQLDYLELGFENCEIARIPGKYIGDFYVGDLEITYERVACNAIEKMNHCHKFAVEIHKDVDMQTYTYAWEGTGERHSLFSRIKKYPDITSIKFSIDGKESYFWTDYDEETSNPPQKCYISKLGHMYLIIGEKAGLSDFFDKEEVDDADYVDFCFDMYDVGDANQRNYDIEKENVMRYRKKPVVVEAIQFDGENFMECCDFMGNPKVFHTDMGAQKIFIDTLEGEMAASKGDFIIRGISGEYYPCKPDIFWETYDPAD